MRVWLFRAIALILPVLVLVLAELAIRATGTGDNWPLFKVNPANPAYLVTEADIVKRYFANNTALPSVKKKPFGPKVAPKRCGRIFIGNNAGSSGRVSLTLCKLAMKFSSRLSSA